MLCHPYKAEVPRVSKEFELGHKDISNVLPVKGAYEACVGGKHIPVNPHRQRLLVAAHKPAKLKGGAGNVNNNSKKKKKTEPPAEAPPANPSEPEAPPANPSEPAQELPCASKQKATQKQKGANKTSAKTRHAYPDTPYNVARKAFHAMLLDLDSATSVLNGSAPGLTEDPAL